METNQKISKFFAGSLSAPLHNSRWSWGAVNPKTGQVYLRVWTDERRQIGGHDSVAVYSEGWTSLSPGFPERRKHVQLIQNGAESFGILCTPRDTSDGKRHIAEFDSKHLLSFDGIVTHKGYLYASIGKLVKVEDALLRETAARSLVTDLEAIFRESAAETTRKALVEARLGQGSFRNRLLTLWGGTCSVTGSTTLDAVLASHIKPWCKSAKTERLDPYNGLPLIANLDALFDAGLISFLSDGKMLLAKSLNTRERKLLSLHQGTLCRTPSKRTAKYLEYHRKFVFVDELDHD